MFASTENPIVIKPPPMRTGPGKQQNHLQSYVKVGKKKKVKVKGLVLEKKRSLVIVRKMGKNELPITTKGRI